VVERFVVSGRRCNLGAQRGIKQSILQHLDQFLPCLTRQSVRFPILFLQEVDKGRLATLAEMTFIYFALGLVERSYKSLRFWVNLDDFARLKLRSCHYCG